MIRPTTPKIDLTPAVGNSQVQNPRFDTGPAPMSGDQLFTTKTDQLLQLLEVNQRARPDMIRRAEALANDPAYPPAEIIRRLSQLIVKAEDPSEKLD